MLAPMTKPSFPKGLKSGREWKEPDRTARIAIIDACVLVQAPLRGTPLRLAEPPGIYQPLWSEDIIVEVKRALERQIGLAPSKTAYLERELRRHFPDSWVTGYEPLIRKMTNDEKDRHVLAAAVRARASKIVTFTQAPLSTGRDLPLARGSRRSRRIPGRSLPAILSHRDRAPPRSSQEPGTLSRRATQRPRKGRSIIRRDRPEGSQTQRRLTPRPGRSGKQRL